MDLPWVKTANHLGIELSEECNMVSDMQDKRADFDPVKDPLPSLKKEILALKVSVPVQDSWRLPCLQKFLARKYALEADHQDTGEIDKLIDSLCMS